MPTIVVVGANDLPPPNPGTSIGVTGDGFAPLTEVRILIRQPTIDETATVDADGRFTWATTIRPQLPVGAPLEALVKAPDGTEVEGTGEVFGIG